MTRLPAALALEDGHAFLPVPLWAAARRCGFCRLVVAQFNHGGTPYAAYMSGGVLLGDTLDPGFVPPACRTAYAPHHGGMAERRRPWAAVHAAAGRTARPTPAQARALALGLADGLALTGRAAAATVARLRDLGWLDRAYRANPAGAAALLRVDTGQGFV
jgi:hypothetical protein